MPRTRQLERAGGLVYEASVRHVRNLRSYHDKVLSWYGGTERPLVKTTFVPRQAFIEVRSSVTTNVNYVRAELEIVPRQIYRGTVNSPLEGFELGAEINGDRTSTKKFYHDKKGGLGAVRVAGNTCFTLVQTSWVRSRWKVLSWYGRIEILNVTNTVKSMFVPRLSYHDKTYGGEYNYEGCSVCLGWVLRWCS